MSSNIIFRIPIAAIPIFEMHRLEATWVRSCRLPRVLKLSRDSAVDSLNCLQVLTHHSTAILLHFQTKVVIIKIKKERQKFIGG